jgi:hypothetical protein
VDVSFDPFPKNQNLKRFIETQKVNKDREEDGFFLFGLIT